MFNVDINKMIASINKMINFWWTINLGITSYSQGRRILKNSYNEASLRGDFISDDEHLLAMLKEPEGVASRVLKSFSLDYETVSDLMLSDEGIQITGGLDSTKNVKQKSKTNIRSFF